MTKRKYPSELNTRTVRVNIGTWQMLIDLSQKFGTTVAETVDKIITERVKQEETIIIPKTQIPWPELRVTTTPVIRVTSKVTTAVNGAGTKHSAFKIKPKGGVINE